MPDRPVSNATQPGSDARGKAPAGISYEETYRSFYAQVVRQLTYLLGDRAAAEDVAQETFLKLYTVPPRPDRTLGAGCTRSGRAWP